MKKFKILIICLFAGFIIVTFLSFKFFELADNVFIEPAIASNIKSHNFVIIDDNYCSEADLNDRSYLSCELSKQGNIDDLSIIRIFGEKHKYKEKFSIKNYSPENDSHQSFTISLFAVIAADAFDAYSLEYSDKYKEKWNYSKINIYDNYRDFTARFATAIFTTHYNKNDCLIFDNNQLIITTESKSNLLVRRIYQDIEEYYVFSKQNITK